MANAALSLSEVKRGRILARLCFVGIAAYPSGGSLARLKREESFYRELPNDPIEGQTVKYIELFFEMNGRYPNKGDGSVLRKDENDQCMPVENLRWSSIDSDLRKEKSSLFKLCEKIRLSNEQTSVVSHAKLYN